MKEKNKLGCMGWLLFSVPFIMIVMGILMEVLSFMTVQDVKKATAQTTATVISEKYRTELDTSKDYYDPDRRQEVRYITLAFTINGEQRWKTGRNDDLKVGEELTVWYDPGDTSGTNDRVFIEGYDDFGDGISLFGLLPIAIGVGILICAFISSRKKRAKAADPQEG